MIPLGLGLLAASIVGLTIESGGIALVLFSAGSGCSSTRRPPQPSGAGFTNTLHFSLLPAHYQHRHASVH